MKKKYRFAVYSRKSRITERGESIENQGELCKRYIEAHFFEVFQGNTDNNIILYYEDEGFSGGNTNRPAFKRLMDEAKPLGITHIVCYRLDRISRSIGDFAKLIEDLRRREIEFISIKEQFDTQTPIGRAMMYIASVFSQLERETIAERIRDNMTELAKSGRWLGGVTPTGYRSVRIKEKDSGRVRYALELCEEEADTVREIYRNYEEFGSLSMTEKVLKKRGVLSKNNKFYTRETIKSILSNPVYAVMCDEVKEYLEETGGKVYITSSECDEKQGRGVMAFNKTCLAPSSGARRQAPTAPENRIYAPGEHRGIIEGPRWTGVQRQLLSRSRKKEGAEVAVRARGKVGLLAGALRCPLCGALMRVKKGTAEGSFYYRCGAKYGVAVCGSSENGSGEARCRCENVNGAALDDLVITAAAAFLADAAVGLPPACCVKIRENCRGSFPCEDRRPEAEKQQGDALQKLIFALEHANSVAACEAILKRIEELTAEVEKEPEKVIDICAGEPSEFIAQMLKKITLHQRRNVILTILEKIEILP